MPVMNGRELARPVTAERPDVRVLYMSGYTGDIMSDIGVEREQVALLRKPITPAALLMKVRQTLGAGRASTPPPSSAG
jgi:CheY-like chemotaxis protein